MVTCEYGETNECCKAKIAYVLATASGFFIRDKFFPMPQKAIVGFFKIKMCGYAF